MADERTLVLIRERSLLDVLDLAFVVARRKAMAIGAAALAGIAPFEAFNHWATTDAAAWLGLVLLEAPLATAPLTVLLGGLMFGRRDPARKIAATLGRGLFPLLLYQGLLRAALLCSLVLSWVVPVRLLFVNEVILLERPRWTKVLGRSGRLSRERGFELLGAVLVWVVFGAMFAAAFAYAARNLVAILIERKSWEAPHDGFSGPRAWVFRAGVWLVVAFFAIARFLTYIDQRIRLEGWEVALRLRSAGTAMEEAEKW